MKVSSRPRQQRGNALIEFVLIMPLLLTIMLGAIDWGWYFAVREVAINATRQGARVGSVAPAGSAAADGRTAANTYLTNALGAAYAVTPVPVVGICPGTTYQCITVSLTNLPVVPSRPTSSISGLIAWTRVPPTVTAQTVMRLEP
jgi:Flp pilus assembly protein TadG